MAGRFKVDTGPGPDGPWQRRAGFKSWALACREVGRMARGDNSAAGLLLWWRISGPDELGERQVVLAPSTARQRESIDALADAGPTE